MMKILQLCTSDRRGGAEKVALDLHLAYLQEGHDARLLVKHKRSNAPRVSESDPYVSTLPWGGILSRIERFLAYLPWFRGKYRLYDVLRYAALPRRFIAAYSGQENFHFPESHLLLANHNWQPDVIQAHNLHGDYFDLAALPFLSHRVPFVWTLHDTWALTGHCGSFIDCNRWLTGCGSCPDLRRPPSIRRDRTKANWTRKQQIYADSRLCVATPSQWLMNCVNNSMLRPYEKRVIPNGVNQSVYSVGDRIEARRILDIPQTAFVGLFVAAGGNSNPYKDLSTVQHCWEHIIHSDPSANILLICLGQPTALSYDPRFRYPGYIAEIESIVNYYRAADVLLHAANADNFPLTVLEAMACGTPVIATGVCGISEQISDGLTGFLVPRQDADAMAERVFLLMRNRAACLQMGIRAKQRVDELYSLSTQSDAYLEWFHELIEE